MAAERYPSFSAFFPFYLSEHADPRNRALHYLGTSGVIATAVTAVATGFWWALLALPVIGYGPAWVGHFLVERNRPATFSYPVWSLMGDFKMFYLFITGQLQEHLPAGEQG